MLFFGIFSADFERGGRSTPRGRPCQVPAVSRPPLVSIVLPARNAAPTIARAVASVCGQTLADWELVVVNDGSTDDTAAVVSATAAGDPRVRVLDQPALGLVAALNAGLAAAGGEFVARLDADDEAAPGRLAAQVDFLRARPEVGVVSSLVSYGGDAARNAGYALHVDWLNSLVTPEEIALNRFIESPVAHPSVLFRRELVARHGGYRAGDFPEDYELWLRWLDAGVTLAKVPAPLVTWHDRPARLSRTDPRYAPEAFFRVKAEYVARHLVRAGQTAVWVWGAGRHTRKRAAHLEAHGLAIAGYIDVDAKKTGRTVAGRPVVTADDLPAPGGRFVLGYVTTRGARDYIRRELGIRGYGEGRDFLMCA
jgi:glycosyltransferase involved in cell wall biosynthesis